MALDSAVELVTEEVASNLEEVASATRAIDTRVVGSLLVGLGIGLAVGFYIGYRWNREKLRMEAFKDSQEEVEKIREAYASSHRTTSVPTEKPTIEEVIEERGYQVVEEESSVTPLTRPGSKKSSKKSGRPTKPPVVVKEPTIHIPTPGSVETPPVWDYAAQIAWREANEGVPYVIHQDEYAQSETGYSKVAFTYYAGDDVLVGEDERPIPHADIIVGQTNLKFGLGTDDPDVVFVRNETMEMEMEICRTHLSYEQEVLGLENDNPPE